METQVGYLLGEAAVVFLFVLSSHLRGRHKEHITNVLGLFIFAICIVVFFRFGWRWGLASIAVAIFGQIVFEAGALLIARRLLGYRVDVDSEAIRPDQFWREIQTGDDSRKINRQQRLKSIMTKADIRVILQENGFEELEGFEKLYWELMRCGLDDLKYEILSSPQDLKDLILLIDQEKSPDEIAHHFRFGMND